MQIILMMRLVLIMMTLAMMMTVLVIMMLVVTTCHRKWLLLYWDSFSSSIVEWLYLYYLGLAKLNQSRGCFTSTVLGMV